MPWWPRSPDRESGRDEVLCLRRSERSPRGLSCDNEAAQVRCSRCGASGPRPCLWPGGPSAWPRREPGWPRRHRLSTWVCPWLDHSRRPGQPRWRRGDRTCRLDGASDGPVGRSRGPRRQLASGSARQARAIGPGALHADLGDVAKAPEPAEQRLVARSVGLEALRAEQTSERVEGRCHVNVEVGIDTTGHTTRQLLRWSWSSLLSLWCEGWHGRSGSERRAAQACCCKPGQSPQLGDGTCRCQSAAGGSRPTTFCNVTGLQVRPDRPALPKLFGTSNQAVDPSEKYQ